MFLKFFVALCGCCSGLNGQGLASQSDKIVLESGESQVLTVPSGSAIDVSPRKLVEVETAGKGKVRVIGLKSGVALLKATGADEEQTYIIEVLSRDGQNDWLLRSEWKTYFCSRNGIVCDAENKIISGESDDVMWFFEARSICRKKMPCSWKVRLQERARLNSQNALKQQFPEVGIRLTKEGRLVLDSDCEEREAKRLQQIAQSLEDLYATEAQIHCIEKMPDHWLIDFLVIAERESEGDMSNPLRWERIEIPSDKPLRVYIGELSQNNTLRVVANPEFSLSLGSTAVLKDGQEIQTLAIQKDSEEILWKQAGFRLEIKLHEIRKGLARVQVKLNLSQPQSGLRTIDSSEFASEAWIPLGRLLRIGRIQANLKGNEETRIPWLGAIPFLGAIFRWENDTSAKSQVDVMLRIRPGVPILDSHDTEDSTETESGTLSPAVPVE